MKEINAETKAAFEKWMKANKWTSTLTRSESGKLGAAKKKLFIELKKSGLSFEYVAQTLC